MTRRPSPVQTAFSLPDTPEEVVTVSAVTCGVSRLIREGTRDLWVRGEVAEYKVWRSGHHYFCIRDAHSQLRCVMWKNDAVRVQQAPAHGTEVFLFGRPTLWEEKGEFRFTAKTLLPTAAVGAAHLELERIKAALQKEGLLDPARKRPLPRHPLRIAIITSIDGAALRDVAIVTRRRWPLAHLLVVGAQVQGDGAPESIVKALALVCRLTAVDLCIVTRGGGARDDLAAFNAESVCRALAALPMPSVSAVGHETDISLTDLVADHRSATPSAAMEEALPDHRELVRSVGELGRRLASGLSSRTRIVSERLERYGDRYRAAVEAQLLRRSHRLERGAARLDALSPLKVLERGFGVALDDRGRVLRTPQEFTAGMPFTLRLADGTVAARTRPTSEDDR